MLNSTKPTKFTDAKPGSTVRVTDTEGSFEPFEALVLEMKPEYGPSADPALILKPDYGDDPIILTASGRYRIEILLDSSVLADGAEAEHLVRFSSKPSVIEAIKFAGGIESATEIIRHFAGKAAISWHAADATGPEKLVIATASGPQNVAVGVWVAEGAPNDVYPIPADVMVLKYEEIAAK